MQKKLLMLLMLAGVVALAGGLYASSQNARSSMDDAIAMQRMLSGVDTVRSSPEKLTVPQTCSGVTMGDLSDMCETENLSDMTPQGIVCFRDLRKEVEPGTTGDEWVVIEACSVSSIGYRTEAERSDEVTMYIELHLLEVMDLRARWGTG